MKRATQARTALLLAIVLALAMLASACAGEVEQKPRLTATYTYNPGAQFQTNVSDADPRRVVRCSIVFEVIDEAAIEELFEYNYTIRNAVLIVLGKLTMDELTEGRDLVDISQKLVDQVNEAINSNYPLVLGAYFTDFLIA